MAEYAMIRIGSDIHKQVKMSAALYGMTIREFTERALAKMISPEAKTLIDTRSEYTTKGEGNA